MGIIRALTSGSTHDGVLQMEKEDILEGKIDSLIRRLEKMVIEKKEAQDLKAAEATSTCEECGGYGRVQKDCPEEAVRW
jgi:hypothetical protein